MSLDAIEKLLHQSMGLHSSTVGSNIVHQAVTRRMRACSIDTIADYLSVIRKSATELSALVETVVIPETWFFRDHHPFVAFSDWVMRNQTRFTTSAPLQILSLPCATGEESYTLAMCLADCHIPTGHARIDAIDISQKNLDKAHQAEYGRNSFRGSSLVYRDRYFHASGERHKLKPEIRQRVNFERGNLLDPGFAANRRQYHVIFCRNLLIYFDRLTQQLAIDRLEQILASSGLLFLGHSETCLLQGRPFTALDYPSCFGFERRAELPQREQIAERNIFVPPQRNRRTPTRPSERPGKPLAQPIQQPMPAAGNNEASDPTLIEKAFRLANEGHLDEAATICETLLEERHHQADAHYLLGLVRESAGNSKEAEQLYRKAVYLEPDHFQALTHLSLIAGRSGDTRLAARLRDRAARAQATANDRGVKR